VQYLVDFRHLADDLLVVQLLFQLAHRLLCIQRMRQLIRDMAKYYRVDPALRAAKQAEWNAPVRWPLALVAIGVLALLWAARRSVRQRETATARRRAAA
jgi:hypothetical protein